MLNNLIRGGLELLFSSVKLHNVEVPLTSDSQKVILPVPKKVRAKYLVSVRRCLFFLQLKQNYANTYA
jgi:hypothetical protein